MPDVRETLRRELESRGLDVASDTIAARGELYVKGDGDLAATLFEFKPTVCEAMDTMYQGHWIEGLPPRAAVLPADAAFDPYFELLEQARIVPLLYERTGDDITFIDLEGTLEALGV